jgi:excisionase family DNA binding protein
MRLRTAQHPSSSSTLFVGVDEAARILGVSRSLAYAMANLWLAGGEDGLPAIRLGRRILIRRATLDEWASADAVASRSVHY